MISIDLLQGSEFFVQRSAVILLDDFCYYNYCIFRRITMYKWTWSGLVVISMYSHSGKYLLISCNFILRYSLTPFRSNFLRKRVIQTIWYWVLLCYGLICIISCPLSYERTARRNRKEFSYQLYRWGILTGLNIWNISWCKLGYTQFCSLATKFF